VAGEIDDPTTEARPRRQVFEGRRPLAGLGQPQTKAHESLVADAHRLMEAFQRDPETVDPTLVGLLQLQAFVTYGGAIDGLKQEIARLRKQVELASRGDEDEPEGARTSARVTRLARHADRTSARTRLRGRAR
jgi:hypothetical protein